MHRPVPMTLVPTITKSPSLPRQPPPPYPASSHPPAVPLFTSLPSPVTQIGTHQRPQHKPPKTTKSLYIVSYAHSVQIGISHYYQTEKKPSRTIPFLPYTSSLVSNNFLPMHVSAITPSKHLFCSSIFFSEPLPYQARGIHTASHRRYMLLTHPTTKPTSLSEPSKTL